MHLIIILCGCDPTPAEYNNIIRPPHFLSSFSLPAAERRSGGVGQRTSLPTYDSGRVQSVGKKEEVEERRKEEARWVMGR
jgi:hypothetical protein